MAKHEVSYDSDGLSRDDPWSLFEYLGEDGLSTRDIDRVTESVLSWLREYETAGCDLSEALNDLAKQVEGEPARPTSATDREDDDVSD